MESPGSLRIRVQAVSALLLGMALTTAPGLSGADDNAADNHALGKALYDEACASCHGSAGKGDGEFAQYLNIRPPNLTLIAKSQSDGRFPFLNVFHIVDGRTGVRGHGKQDMPIWGNVFSRDIGDTGGPYGSELLIRARLVALVDYLESLQVE